MNTIETKENINTRGIETSKNIIQAKTSLKMLDSSVDDEIETENPPRRLKRSPSEINRLKFLNMKSLKISKRNTINSVENNREEISSKTDRIKNQIEIGQNNSEQLKILNREGTINLISEICPEEIKSEDSPSSIIYSPSVKYFKDNLLLNGAEIANLRRLSLSSVNNLNTNNSNELEQENLEIKISGKELNRNEDLINQDNNKEDENINTTNYFLPNNTMKYEFDSPQKKESSKFIDRRMNLTTTINQENTKKISKKLADSEFNNYIKNLLTRNDEDTPNDLPKELIFLLDIEKHENRLVDDVEITSLFNKYQVAHFLITIFTILGIASGVLVYEIKLNKSVNLNSSKNYNSHNLENRALDTCLIVCSISNLLFIIISILRYSLYIRIKKALVDYSKHKNIWNTNLWIYLFLEIIMSLLHPNIFCKNIYFKTNRDWYLLEVEYCLNDYLMIVMLLKSYVILRSVISISDYTGERADRVMKMFGGDSSLLFGIKCMLRVNPFYFILFIFISTALILAYMMKIIEGPVYFIDLESQALLNDFSKFSNCIWYTFITMGTVGYGDYFPKTNFGRLIGITAAISGTVFVSIFIIYLQRYLSLNQTERTAVNFLNRLNYKNMIKDKASFFFLNSFRYNKAKNKYLKELNNPNKNIKNIEKLKKEVEFTFYEKTTFNKMFKRLVHVFRNIYELPNDYDLMNTKIKDTEKKIDLLKLQGLSIKNTIGEIKNLVRNMKQSKDNSL